MRTPSWFKDTRNLGVLAALAVLLVVVLYATHHTIPSPSVTSDNQLVVPSFLLAENGANATNTATSSNQSATTTESVKQTQTANVVSAVNETSPSTPTTQTSNVPAKELTASGGKLLKSLVNIVCVSGDSSIPSISGSGVIIDSRGIILTAAHVAQFFLLQDYLGPDKVECIVRTGSPARRAYFAEPIYVSPTWIQQNPKTITTVSPQGTGENDFALLAITGSATSTPLSNSFPAIPLAPDNLTVGEPIAIGSYGAQYLTATELNYDLYPILVFGSIQDRYTYGGNTVDVVSIMGSAASQEGSSGGGIVDGTGRLQGVITTSSIAGSISDRSLNAITVGHIRRSYRSDTGLDLDIVLQNNSLASLVANFAAESKQLGQQLVANIGASSH